MECFCCGSAVATGRHVKLRGDVRQGMPDAPYLSAAYIAYKESTTYRSSFVCESCYGVLDSVDGIDTQKMVTPSAVVKLGPERSSQVN